MHVLRRTIALLAAAAVPAATLLAVTGMPAAQAAHATDRAKLVLTDFGLQAAGWSTQVSGGDVAARSGPTGLAAVGCTRNAGRHDANNTLAVALPAVDPLVQVGVTETHAWSNATGDTVSSNTVNDVSTVTIGDPASSALVFDGVQTRSRAFHDATGFHRSGMVTVAAVTQFTNGIAVKLHISGQPVTVPGLVTVTFGQISGATTDRSASARVNGLRIDLDATNSTVWIGRVESRIDGGAVAGVMQGAAWGSTLDGAEGVASSGRTAVRPLPCLGTDGQWRSHPLAAVQIADVIDLDEIVSRIRGDQEAGNTAYAQGTSTITRAGLIGRQIVVSGIRAEGIVRLRSDGGLVRSTRGTTVGRITVAGVQQAIPARGETLTIPGVARISVGMVTNTSDGLTVTAVRVVLLNGTHVQGRLNLGNVDLGVHRS